MAPHFVLIPLMAQGHMIPMIDMARLFAERGVMVSLVTTHHNASRFDATIDRARSAGLPINLVRFDFPSREFGLPVGYENLDSLPSQSLLGKFFQALNTLQAPLEKFMEEQNPSPSCIISDKSLFWTSETAMKFDIPRIVFHGMSCFSLLATHNIKLHNAHLSARSDSELFPIPGLPGPVRITRAQLPGAFVAQPDLDDFRHKMIAAESNSFGVVANTFEGVEHGSTELLSAALGHKPVWSIGPVSLSNREALDRAERGNRAAAVERDRCLAWLDGKEPGSVVYACLGSQCRLAAAQLAELGLGLARSGRAFVWVVKRDGDRFDELEEWLRSDRFEEWVAGRGLVIKGWAPQLLILQHRAVGAFLTHCGWNSTLEGLCSGLPMITWPLFAEQFLNETLIVEVLRVGVRVGVKVPVRWGDEERVGVLVNGEDVTRAIEQVISMDGGDGDGGDDDGDRREERERRGRARELGERARMATAKGGSSHSNISRLIEDVMREINGRDRDRVRRSD